MATSFPGALDDFTNPNSGNTLDSPSHSSQHSDANDALEAVEAKVGINNSPAGSAASGFLLLADGAGGSDWSSIADTNAVVLTEGGSTIFPSDADTEGLVIRGGTPEIATVGSVSANGTTITYTASNTFAAGQAVQITGVNPNQFNFDTAVLATAGTGNFTVTNAATGTYVSGGTAILYQGNLQEWKDFQGNVVASVNQFGKSNFGGLVHIESQTFSAVASISFNDVFSATFLNYKIISNAKGTTGMGLNFRLRVGGVDNSSSNYRLQEITADNTSISGSRSTGLTSWPNGLGIKQATERNLCILEVANPFEIEFTAARNLNIFATSGNIEMRDFSFGINVTTSFTGFTAIASTSTMTGSISVYGYSKG